MISERSLDEFDDSLLETIKEVLDKVFGKRASEVILGIMKKRYSLEWGKIPENPGAFACALREILGYGALIVEDLILETLVTKLKYEKEFGRGYEFPDYVNALRRYEKTQGSERRVGPQEGEHNGWMQGSGQYRVHSPTT